ncbi:MAG: hypothetical protein PHY92_08455 [Alphaproteobacteria bacterium]|nr:hypothetical protein [Alphaproteobacteria bacterium]
MKISRRLRRVVFLLSLLSAAAAGMMPSQGARAMVPADDVFVEGGRPLSSEEMTGLRAGFIDPTGLIYSFAVDVKSMVDGTLAFVRSLVLQAGPNGQFNAVSNAQLLPQNLPAGMVANITNNGGGLTVTDNNGNTTFLNQTAGGNFTSAIMNSADNRNAAQTVDMSIVLQNISGVTAGASNAAANPSANVLAQVTTLHNLGLGH